jgi:hypothetical protein
MTSTCTVTITAPDENTADVRVRYYFVDESIEDWRAQSLSWDVVSVDTDNADLRAVLTAYVWPDWATTQMDEAVFNQSEWDAATWREERGCDV